TPPRSSRSRVEPRSVILKKRSIPLRCPRGAFRGLVGPRLVRSGAGGRVVLSPAGWSVTGGSMPARGAVRKRRRPRGPAYSQSDPMELRDDQPIVHESGNRTYLVANVAPLDSDGVRPVEVRVALWVAGVVAPLP